MTSLQKFLYELKVEGLEKEKKATGIARLAMTMQLQVIDSMFQFLASKQTEEDMGKLRLTLAKQATPVDDIKPRQDNAEITDALIELAEDLGQAWKDEVKRAEKAKEKPKDIKFPLDNIPPEIKRKTVSSKIYGLRVAGKIPENILPATRTSAFCEHCQENRKGGYVTDDGKCSICKQPVVFKEELYMKWVKNPPPVKVKQGE